MDLLNLFLGSGLIIIGLIFTYVIMEELFYTGRLIATSIDKIAQHFSVTVSDNSVTFGLRQPINKND